MFINKPRIKAEALEMFMAVSPLLSGLITAIATEYALAFLGDGPAFAIAVLTSSAATLSSFQGLNDVYVLTRTRLLAEADQIAAAHRDTFKGE